MDERRVDDLTRTLAASTSQRGPLGRQGASDGVSETAQPVEEGRVLVRRSGSF